MPFENYLEGVTMGVMAVHHRTRTAALLLAAACGAVHALVSDRPDLVREEMTRRGLPLPKATAVQP
jgi:hypothetical protein